MATKRGKNGGGDKTGKGGHHDASDEYEHVIEFTPSIGFDIKKSAKNFSEMMADMLQPLIIHLPHVSVEFEPGCTPKEIIDGYSQAIQHKVCIKHSNSNTKAPKGG